MTTQPSEIPREILDPDALFDRLSAGLCLVTANHRLARILHGQFVEWRSQGGARQWRQPDILAWGQWIERLWESAALDEQVADGAVPGAQQLQSIWMEVLRDDPLSRQQVRLETLASSLAQSRALLTEWDVDADHPAWRGADGDNHAAFRRWMRAFDAQCRRDGWLPPEDRAPRLTDAVIGGRLEAPGPIGLLGFDELTPVQARLIAALRAGGAPVSQLQFPASGGTVQLWRARDGREELRQMARWARFWFEREPGSRIAIVVPDLEQRSDEVEQQLAECLLPGADGAEHSDPPWNLSLGRPLVRAPMIAAALRMLRLARPRVDIRDVGDILRSPWFEGSGEEWSRRARLERLLRDRYPKSFELRELVYRSDERRRFSTDGEEFPEPERPARPWRCPAFHGCAAQLQRFERESRDRRQPSGWAKAFDELLSSVGWPLAGRSSEVDGQGLNESAIWPIWQAWQEALRELATLDATSRTMSREEALRSLEAICRSRLHRPQGSPARIQVLGPYEICGLRFDHLWILGLHSDNWPNPARPDPFIPLSLQREAGMPRSSPERELRVARTVTHRLLETAGDTVVSYPGLVDGEPTLPSALFEESSEAGAAAPPAWPGPSWAETVFRAPGPAIESPRMPGPCRNEPRGGSSLLRRQALCPFRAFARNRLDAEGLETPAEGVHPKVHGSLTHRVMESFWRETGCQAGLAELDDAALETRVRTHAERLIEAERGLWGRPALGRVECDRLVRLVCEALQAEREREPFEVVAFEEEAEVCFAGQPVRLRIDRIDRMRDGGSVIIDYKTGKANPGKWFGERPEDPQLPLYAIASESPPAAVVFAQLRAGESGYAGVVSRAGIVPGLPPRRGHLSKELIAAGENLPATVDRWRESFEGLMDEFLSGHAPVNPVRGEWTCTDSYCRLKPLCRIGELDRLRRSRGEEPDS